MSAAEEPGPDPLLLLAIEAVSEIEARRDQQAVLVAELADQPDARARAEFVLKEIEQTLMVARAHRDLIESLA